MSTIITTSISTYRTTNFSSNKTFTISNISTYITTYKSNITSISSLRVSDSGLAAKLEELIADSGERKRLKNAALARARENYNWGKVADEYEKILEKLSPKKISGM